MKDEFMTKLQACCCQIDRILQTNKSTEGWAVGKKVTIVDSKITENIICISNLHRCIVCLVTVKE